MQVIRNETKDPLDLDVNPLETFRVLDTRLCSATETLCKKKKKHKKMKPNGR